MATALLACSIAPIALSSSGAQAKSAATLRQEAQRILATINANGERISILDEQINEAQGRLTALQSEITRTSLQIKSAQRTIGHLHTSLVARAAALYRGAGGAADLAAQSAASVQQQGAMSVYSEAAAAQDQQRIDQYRNARDARTRAKAQLAKAEAAQSAQLASLKSQQRRIERLSSEEQALYNQKNVELRNEIQAEQQAALNAQLAAAAAKARAAAAAARASTRQVSSGGGSNSSVNLGPPPPVSGGASTAVYWAEQEIGKPYLYATAGPNTFDCSGLTMWAWGHAGVSMSHNAAAQYDEFPHVAIGNVQPGDLVFYGSPIHHVGIVVGGGQMVEASHAGTPVRYASYFRSDLVGAARP